MELISTGSPWQKEQCYFSFEFIFKKVLCASFSSAINVAGKCRQTGWDCPDDSCQLIRGQGCA